MRTRTGGWRSTQDQTSLSPAGSGTDRKLTAVGPNEPVIETGYGVNRLVCEKEGQH